MKDYKLRQQMFHQLEFTDDWLSSLPHIVQDELTTNQLIHEIVQYFVVPVDVLSFPAKSYAVAIIYSILIEYHFNERFYTVLSDPELFVGTDKFFKPYGEAKNIYDSVLSFVRSYYNSRKILNAALPQINATIEYFHSEFYLNSNPYFSN